MLKKKRTKWLFFSMVIGWAFLSCDDEEIAKILVEQITLTETDIRLGIGEVKGLVLNPIPENANSSDVTWISSDPSVAEIQFSENGLVAGVKGMTLGSTTLTASSNTSGIQAQTIVVDVITKIQEIELEEEEIADPAQTKYNVIFTPEDASIKNIDWTSSDPSVATVDSEGIITAVSAGVTVVSATADEGGHTATVEIIVSGDPPVLGLIYCSASGTGSYNPQEVVTTGGGTNINNTEDQPGNNYNYYEGEKLTVAPDGSFDITIVQSNNWSMTVVWIDWNGDKDFLDDGERVQVFGQQAQLNDGPFNGTINVPVDAAPGLVRMRVLTGDAWTTDPDADPCGEIANSTTKDFDVEIVGKIYCPVSGTGGYNPDSVKATGASMDIDHTGGQPGGNYEFVTDQNLVVSQGGSFTLEVVQSNNWSLTVVWVDWNSNGDFSDAGERIQVFGEQSQLNDGPFNATINVPADATIETVRMRVLTGDAWTTDPDADPCGEIANSTTKDFNVEIQ
ncbi:GEVED domain-containing protein [Flagellimonas myxillae]|uniref:GEVED domain-containing protein n=1 Tax=Flagellimonas myxillae TaxID=2942214 RepID=UPI00201EB32F|nr:GEVED domain-containing protein [Muricauda myxillae]MCL6266922.1 GEVED domain-containing protein [Muricauda myxillae]